MNPNEIESAAKSALGEQLADSKGNMKPNDQEPAAVKSIPAEPKRSKVGKHDDGRPVVSNLRLTSAPVKFMCSLTSDAYRCQLSTAPSLSV
jgi:hypothetical protein